MNARSVLTLAVLAGALATGCGPQPTRFEAAGLIASVRPELVTYVDESGAVAFVWGHGPVNFNCLLRAHCPAHPVGRIGTPLSLGAAFRGSAEETPAPGDTITMSLLPCPLVDSLGVTAAGATLISILPDTLEAHAWAVVPTGPCGPDTIQTWARLGRVP